MTSEAPTHDFDSMSSHADDPYTLRFRTGSLPLDGACRIMGILNVTPDSFSDGGSFRNAEAAVTRGLELVEEGADIIDLGGESTRPGAAPVSVEEECRRILPVLERLRTAVDVPISVDTRKAEVARRALGAGADMINDVSALRFDNELGGVIAAAGAPVVLMHMQGDPGTMQDDPRYGDVVEDVLQFFVERIAACRRMGISQIVIDPGIGFGKRLEHNLALLRHLDRLTGLGCPVLVGTSRKSFIGQITGLPVEDRLGGSVASNIHAALKGAHILRVHDVAQVRSAVQVAFAIQRN